MQKYVSKIIIPVALILMVGLFWGYDTVAAPPPPLLEFDFRATTIPYNTATSIVWMSENATSCTASGGWSGSRPSEHGVWYDESTGSLISSTAFTLTCTGDGGSVAKTLTVTVGPPPLGSTETSCSEVANLCVQTDGAENVTYTTATLYGTGGYTSSPPFPSFPITAYFRYSKSDISPIFCNDIYGTNMIATKDIRLNLSETLESESFYQNITGLAPDTTYFYCAIISNKDHIAYGGQRIVKNFHTSPYQTTVKTSSATNVRSSSARLNGSYSSIEKVTTYFQYKKATIDGEAANWSADLCKIEHVVRPGDSNVYGDISCDLSKENIELTPYTRYQFRAVAVINVGAEFKTIYGSTLTFTTTPTGGNDEGGTRTPRTPSAPTPPPVKDRVTCAPPTVFSFPKNACEIPEVPVSCRPPQFYDPIDKVCVERVACTPPQVYFPPNNSCVDAPSCRSPFVLDRSKNACVNPPPRSYCAEYPIDPECLPGPGWDWTGGDTGGWTWTGGGWNGGTWTGGGWMGGSWVGGTWTGDNGNWSGGVWSNGAWTGGNWKPGTPISAVSNPNNGTWTTNDGGKNGTWVNGDGSAGTWKATTGLGGVGVSSWSGTGGAGTGSGSWTGQNGASGSWIKTNGTLGVGNAGSGSWSGTVSNPKDGTWAAGNASGTSGTFATGLGSGSWQATSGRGGTGQAVWIGSGDDSGVWVSTEGSGTFANTVGNNTGSGIWESFSPTAQTGSENGVWETSDGGKSGVWATGLGSGSWQATSGRGGTENAIWTGTGGTSGTWTSKSGSGTWTETDRRPISGSGMWVDLSLGQKSAPPDEALVKSREGIETVFIRQILTHPVYLATYSKGRAPTGAAVGDLAHQFAIKFGYVGADGREIRVSTPNVAAYRLSLSGDKLTVYEYHKGEIVDIRDLTTVFKDKAGYEYYFKK